MSFPSSQANLGLSFFSLIFLFFFKFGAIHFIYQINRLQIVLILPAFNFSIYQAIICKESYFRNFTDGKSLMCSKNRIGPKTVPCGTPESTVTRSDCIPSTMTRCFGKSEIHVQILCRTMP